MELRRWQEARRRIAVAPGRLRQSYRQAHQRGLDRPYQREVLASIVVAGTLASKIDAVAQNIGNLLSIKGVIEVVDPRADEAEDKAAKEAAAAAFDQALAHLVEMRRREGGARANPQSAHGRDQATGQQGGSRARPPNQRRSGHGSPSESRRF